MELTSPAVNFGLGATMLSAIFIFGLLLNNRHQSRIYDPSVPLPQEVINVYPELINGPTLKTWPLQDVPWNRLPRSTYVCKKQNCQSSNPAYVVQLPIRNTAYLSTQDFATGYPTQYPVATVVEIINQPIFDSGLTTNKKSEALYIIDAKPSQNVDSGIVPMIKANGQPLNVDGPVLNVTGDFAHSFVVLNSTSTNVYMPTLRVVTGIDSYWRLAPGTYTLLWPAVRYFNSNSEPVGLHRWNASSLVLPLTGQFDLSASIAEIVMYDVLRKKAA